MGLVCGRWEEKQTQKERNYGPTPVPLDGEGSKELFHTEELPESF
tara:strand:- start:857 stop:991 length:135 start_codon:yes stop_codon:yes gene_type:complete